MSEPVIGRLTARKWAVLLARRSAHRSLALPGSEIDYLVYSTHPSTTTLSFSMHAPLFEQVYAVLDDSHILADRVALALVAKTAERDESLQLRRLREERDEALHRLETYLSRFAEEVSEISLPTTELLSDYVARVAGLAADTFGPRYQGQHLVKSTSREAVSPLTLRLQVRVSEEEDPEAFAEVYARFFDREASEIPTTLGQHVQVVVDLV